eukprot:2634296-Pyramimonas_sp.AAC.1
MQFFVNFVGLLVPLVVLGRGLRLSAWRSLASRSPFESTEIEFPECDPDLEKLDAFAEYPHWMWKSVAE